MVIHVDLVAMIYTVTFMTAAMIFLFRSDIYISAICSNCYGATYYIYTSDMLLNLLNEQKTINRDQFDMLYIESMEVRQHKNNAASFST